MKKFYKLSLLILLLAGVTLSGTGQTVFHKENFDALSNGDYVAEELTTYWDTWDSQPGTPQDGLVSNTYSSSSPNSMKIVQGNDQVLYFKSDKTAFSSGYYFYSHKMYVPTGKSGYFNLQAEFDNIWGFEMNINDPEDNGNSWVDYGDGEWMYINGNVTFDAWMTIDIAVDLDDDEANLWIDGTHIKSWIWSDCGLNELHAVNYWGDAYSSYDAYFDDIVFGVYAGADTTICASATSYTLSDASAPGYDAVTWTTSSTTGSFTNEQIVNAVYNPSAQDKTDGFVTLTLSANKVGSSTPTTDEMKLSFQAEPTADAGADATICIDDTYTTSDASATNYTAVTWTTLSDGTFDNYNTVTQCTYTPGPNEKTAGSFAITLEAANPYCGVVTSTVTVTISKPEVTCPADQDVCVDEDTFTLTDGTPTGGTHSGTGVSGGHFDPGTAGVGTHTITYEVTDDVYGCVSSCTYDIVVHALPPATCQDDFDVCCDDEPVLLNADKSKASYSINYEGEFVTEDNGDYYFTPTCDSIDTFTITYTVTDGLYGCVSSCTFDITVNALPEPDCPDDMDVCCDDEPVILGPAQVKGLTTETKFSGTGVSISGGDYVFTPDCNSIDDFTITKIVTDIVTGCKDSCDFIITVHALPVVTCPDDLDVCVDKDTFTLTDGTPAGGTHSGTGVSNNEFDAATAGVGTWIITYEYEDTYGCVSSCTYEISVGAAPTVDAGDDASICESGYQLDGSVEDGGNTLWTTFGDGTFSNPNILNPFYTPGTEDKASASVKLSLVSESISPCNDLYEDFVWLYIIQDLPTVFAGADATSCETNSYTIFDATATDYSSLLWIRLDADGTFDDNTTLKPEYTFGEGDLSKGYAILKLVASPESPCVLLVEDQITITVQDAPYANAGNDATICEDGTHHLTGASAGNYNALGWYSEFGSGTFDDDSKLFAKYTPGPTDIIQGQVELCLVASPIDPCTSADEDCMILYIQEFPEANAGTDKDICEGATHTLSDASASNYSTVTWLGGDGTFSDRNDEKPTYTPAASEYGTTVTLTLRAYPESPCSDYAEDMVDIFIQKKPTADAGSDGEVCEDDSFKVNDASASDYESLQWYAGECDAKVGAGDGDFALGSDTTLTPTYTPGTFDISGGEVCLKLVAQPIDPCSAPVESTMKLTIKYLPLVNAGTDATLCEDTDKVDLDAQITVGDYDEVLWTHDGQGTIDNEAAASTFYTPSANDTDSIVRFTITVTPASPCETEQEDYFDVYFQPLPTVNAPDSVAVCWGSSYTFTEVTASNYNANAILWFALLSDGTFVDETILNPTYNPGTNDHLTGYVDLVVSVGPVNPPCTNGTNDTVRLYIQSPPVADAGPDAEICKGEVFTVSDASVENESDFSWAHDGEGTLSGETTLTPTYTPAQGETGDVVLTLTAEPISPCDVEDESSMTLTINELPELTSVSLQYGVAPNSDDMAVAGDLDEGYQICLDGVESTDYLLDVDQLTSTVDLEEDNMNPFYHTDNVPADFFDFWAARGVVDTASGWQGIMWDIINGDEPIFYLVATSEVKNGYDYQLIDGLQYQNTPSQELPLTIPGNYPQGDYTFIGTIKDINGCTSENMTMDMEFVHAPTANAGSDAVIADNQTYTVSDASAENYESVSWAHDGNGTLDDGDDDFSPIYTPGAGDAGNVVTLTLFANPMTPCAQQAISTMELTINHAPVVVITKPADKEVVYAVDYTVEGTASDADGTIAKVEVNINDGGWLDATDTDTWTYIATFNHGLNTILARATDNDDYVSDYDTATVYVNLHTISLVSGYQMISTYLNPINPDIVDIMSPVVSDLTEMITLPNKIYLPEFGINTIENWNVMTAYKLRMTQAGEITIAGDPLKDNTLEYEAGSFAYLPVLSDQVSTIDSIFEDAFNDVVIILDLGNPFGIYWPDGELLFLEDLIPGKGYFALFKNQVTVTYPDYEGFMPTDYVSQTFESQSPWPIVKTGDVHVISVHHDALNEMAGIDYVGAFNSEGNCIGYADLGISSGNLPMIVYGDDIYSVAKDGATEGELINFVAYNSATGEETPLIAEFDSNLPEHDGTFTSNGLSIITNLYKSATGVAEGSNLTSIKLFPNPAKGVVNVLLPSNSGNSNVEISNTEGMVVKQLQLNNTVSTIDVSELPTGIYFVKIQMSSRTVIEKLIIQ